MTSLVASIEVLQARKLTTDEVQKLQAFQRLYGIGEDDSLLVVLAMMANSQLILESAPALIREAVEKTIELHASNLREQSVLISKELIAVIAQQINAAASSKQTMPWPHLIGSFMGGMVLMGVLQYLFLHVFR